MPQLSDKSIFQLRPLLKNFATKKSAFVQDRRGRKILCLVDVNNRICLHCATGYDDAANNDEPKDGTEKESPPRSAQVLLRSIGWFQTARKRVQDMCFDPSGTMLLVLCKSPSSYTVC